MPHRVVDSYDVEGLWFHWVPVVNSPRRILRMPRAKTHNGSSRRREGAGHNERPGWLRDC